MWKYNAIMYNLNLCDKICSDVWATYLAYSFLRLEKEIAERHQWSAIECHWWGQWVNILMLHEILQLEICTTLGYIVSLILLTLGHVFRQELCISPISICFTKRLQSRPLKRNIASLSEYFINFTLHLW